MQEHQESLDLNIHRYNRYLVKENKKLQREIDEFVPERIVSRWAGDGNHNHQYTTCDIKLYKPLDVPVIVEVQEMSDHSSRLILESGDWIDIHIGDEINNDTSKTDALLTKMQERQMQDYINSRNFSTAIDDGLESMGRLVEYYQRRADIFLNDPNVQALCRLANSWKKSPEEIERYDLAVKRLDVMMQNDMELFIGAFSTKDLNHVQRQIQEDYKVRLGDVALEAIILRECTF